MKPQIKLMQIQPILAALRRHKAGTILITLQIALTLAIVCNAIFIIEQRITRISRPSGMNESDLLAVENSWVGANNATTLTALNRADLTALRQLPGVRDATLTNSFPLRVGGRVTSVRVDPTTKKEITQAAQYFTDDHALVTMGAKLITGRNFRTDEVTVANSNSYKPPPVIIITKALAERLYPHGSALGKPIYLVKDSAPSTVIGIVERLQVPWPGAWTDAFAGNVVLTPIQLTDERNVYLVRAQPGQLTAISKSVPLLLLKTNRMRVIPDQRGIRTFAEVRDQAYKADIGIAAFMGAISVIMLMVTAAGIVGLTSFWVGQRRKQIGVRRALGATKHDILSYFLTENLLISVGGVIIGALLAIGLNQWMMSEFEMERLSLLYVLAGMCVLMLLGQGAVLAPALRASRVSPVEATRVS